MLSEDTIKQLVTRHLGNVKLIDNLKGIPADFSAMSTTKYKKTDDELTRFDRANNYVSMSTLLSRMEAWAATDLDGLILPREIKES